MGASPLNPVYDFDRVISRTGTHSLKWDRFGQNALPMWVADMDFASPPCVREALEARIRHPVFGYTLAPEDLTKEITKRFSHHYSWEINPEWIVYLPGIVPALYAACRAFAGGGGEVVTFTPVYPPFLAVPAKTGCPLIEVPLSRRDGRYVMDPEVFEAALTPRTRVLLLCHPHNPTGRAFTPDEIETIAAICQQRGIVICSDEIHCDLILEDMAHRPTGSLDSGIAGMTVTLMSPGKTFNIAGLNMAFAVIPDGKKRAAFCGQCSGILPEPNLFGYEVCRAVYRDAEPWRQQLLDVLRKNAGLVLDYVKKRNGWEMDRVESTYLAWLDLRKSGLNDPFSRIREAGVVLSDGRAFGAPGFVRLNFGCPLSLLEEGLARLDTVP